MAIPDIGVGMDLKQTLDVIQDPHQWKRLRSSMSPGFTQRQMAEMLIQTNKCLGS